MEQYHQKIYRYLDRVFENAPDTQAVQEAKEELSANLIDQFEALIQEGQQPEDAYYAAIGSIGDIYEVLDSLKEEDAPSGESRSENFTPLWEEVGALVPYGAGIAIVLLAVILFYRPQYANLWKAAICAVSALLAAGFFCFGHVGKNRKLLPGAIVSAGLLVITFVSAFLPLRPRFEGILWLFLLIVLAGFEAIATVFPFLNRRKEKKDESEESNR